MSLQPGRALGLDPDEPVVLDGAGAAVAWARTIPDFGWEPEVFALFLDAGHLLLRAAWLGAGTTLSDFDAWPDFAVGYAPAGTAAVVLLACCPGRGVDPTVRDSATWDLVRLAHAAQGMPLVDVVFVDGAVWRSLAGAAPG